MAACAQAYEFFLFNLLILTTLYQEGPKANVVKVSETFDEIMKEVSKTFDKIMKDYWDVTLMSLAYAGTGNVLKVTCLQQIHEFQRGCTIPTSPMHS